MVALHICLDERAEHTLHINAAVSEESSVFTRYHGLLHVFGNLLQRHDFTILIPEFGDFRGAIGSVHGRLLRQAGHIKINTFDHSDGITALATLFAPKTAGRRNKLAATPPPTLSVM